MRFCIGRAAGVQRRNGFLIRALACVYDDTRAGEATPLGHSDAMIGAITGDIIGSVHEFANNERDDFPLFVERSSPTDDSLLTWTVAEACRDRAQNYRPYLVKAVQVASRPTNRARLGPAWGAGFSSWVAGGGKGNRESYGNGAAMRVSPVAWFHHDEAEVLRQAELSALPSHAHPEGVKGAQCTALAAWVARMTKDPEAVRKVGERFYGALPSLDEIRKNHRYNETCQGCVPECVAIAAGTRSFEEAVRFACSIRGDADTLGAIVGGISEGLWGVPKDISESARAIAEHAYPGMGEVWEWGGGE